MWEYQYYNLVKNCLASPVRKTRNGDTSGLFGAVIDLPADLINNFPILNGRKIFYKGVVGELAAMLQGASTVQQFKELGCHYWDKWGDADGNLTLDYGTAWRDFNGVDQLKELVEGLTADPMSRRHIITGWRPDRLKMLSLPCCHLLYQWYVTTDRRLNMIWYQRSVDVMVGMPSDIVFAALWNILLAKTVGLKPGDIKMVFGDTHIYTNHRQGADLYMQQYERFLFGPGKVKVELSAEATVFNFNPSMFGLSGYLPNNPIKFELNV